jgi:hypothetical protein
MILKNKFLLLVLLITISSCTQQEKPPGKPETISVPEVKLDIKFKRFEKSLFANPEKIDSNVVNVLRNEYGEFFEIWLTRLSGVLAPVQKQAVSPLVAANLYQYVSDQYIREVNKHCDSSFSDLSNLENELSDAFKRYIVLFKDAEIPKLLTYTSPFTSNVVAMDSMLGIGLHFYLGADYKYYPSLGLPQYMIRRFDKEYMLSDLLKGWLDSEFANDSNEINCLSQMLYQGKIIYLTEILAPEIADTILTGYTAEQLQWATENEYRIWTFLVENQVLYNSNIKTYIKYINDGKGTSGFPQEAPARLGVYTGWQIIRSFMKNNPDVTPSGLMQLHNAQLLLSKSGYKPRH